MSDKQDLPANLVFSFRITFSGGKTAISNDVRKELGEEPVFVDLDISHSPSTSLTILGNLESAHSYRSKLAEEVPKMLISAIFGFSSAIQTGMRPNANQSIPKEKAKVHKIFSFSSSQKAINEQQTKLANLKITRGHKTPRADLSKLRTHYEEVLPMWKEASEIYHQSQNAKTAERNQRWREAVKATYPDLPDDLIECLQPAHKIPEHLNWFFDKGGASEPEHIARAHAARLCGAKDGAYEDSYLQKKLKPSQQKKKAN